MSTPSPSSSPDSTADMAASMGFSSFGAQPRPKKQKISHPPTSSKNASGGNKMPLGKRKPPTGLKRGEGEGVGIRDVIAQTEVAGSGVDTAEEHSCMGGGEAGDDGEEEGEGVVGGDGGHNQETRDRIHALTAVVPTEGNAGERNVESEEEEKAGEVDKGEKGEGFEGKSWREWKQGVRGEDGVAAFFDWSFVEDPWERLREGGGARGRGTGKG
ncbi:MAG: hypothetical protein Q9208_003409 [Pyrenodesmia sp. 3 TL-2023]